MTAVTDWKLSLDALDGLNGLVKTTMHKHSSIIVYAENCIRPYKIVWSTRKDVVQPQSCIYGNEKGLK